MDLYSIIRTIPNFPKEGVLFRDVTPILQNGEYLADVIAQLKALLTGVDFDLVVGPESRGFIFGVPVAVSMGKGFIPVRKAGKLPYDVVSKDYELEYGTATVEMHADAIKKGQRVVIIDDLLATGGTCLASSKMVEEMGGVVAAMVFLIELEALGGREKLKKYDIRTLMKY